MNKKAMLGAVQTPIRVEGSFVEFFTLHRTKWPIREIIGNTNVITDETYKSGLVTPYDTIKTNQIIPDGIINLTLTTSSATAANAIGDYISKWLTVENRVGHKVYAKIINSDDKLRVCWYKGYTSSGAYAAGYDFITGQLLDETSSVPAMKEGIYTITQDMVWSDGYAQLYYYKFAGLPAGTYNITLQLTDLTEIYGAGSEPTNLVTLKSQHPELDKVNPYGYRLIGAGERLPSQYQEVESIECTGTQYIDTGIPYTIGTTRVDFIATANVNSNGYLFCIKSNFACMRCNNSGNVWDTGEPTTVSSQTGKETTFIMTDDGTKGQSCVIYNEDNSNSASRGSRTPASQFNLILFAQKNSSGAFSNFFVGTSKNIKITINNVVVRNYISCIRKKDNKPGMYDTVSGQFFTNQGTGEFVVGPAVNRYEINTEWRWNQLLPNGNFANISYWQGVANLSVENNIGKGTFSSDYTFVFQYLNDVKIGNKILVMFKSRVDSAGMVAEPLFQGFSSDKSWRVTNTQFENFSTIGTIIKESVRLIPLRRTTSTTNIIQYCKDVMVVDLTDLYGQGNEPTTVEQFLSDHPEYNNYVEYAPVGTIGGTIIPLSAPLYKVGDMADTVRTNVGENRKFGTYTFTGNEDIDMSASGLLRLRPFLSGIIKPPLDGQTPANILMAGYETVGSSPISGNIGKNEVALAPSYYFYMNTVNKPTTVQGWKDFVAGKTLLYELSTPTQTLFPEPYKLPSLTSVTDGLKQLTLSEVRNEHVKHLENVQKVEYSGKNLLDLTQPTSQTKNGVTVEIISNKIHVLGTPNTTSGYITFAFNNVVKVKDLSSYILYTIRRNKAVIGVGFAVDAYSSAGTTGGLNFAMSSAKTESTATVNFTTNRLTVNVRYDVGTVDEYFELQLEEGSTATPYEPYFEPTILENLDLKSVGSVRDYIEVANGRVSKHTLVGVVDLGDYDWTLSTQGVFSTAMESITPSTRVNDGYSVSSMYNIGSKTWSTFITQDMVFLIGTSSSNMGKIFIRNTAYNSADNFKTAMQGQKLYYERSTPIVQDITNSEIGQKLLGLFTQPKCTNIVTVDNDGRVVVKYRR